jgi:hypothetical protein
MRLAVVFGLPSALSLVLQQRTVGVLLGLLAAVFALKLGFYIFWKIKTRYFRPFAADVSLFDRRVAELEDDELIERADLIGSPVQLEKPISPACAASGPPIVSWPPWRPSKPIAVPSIRSSPKTFPR